MRDDDERPVDREAAEPEDAGAAPIEALQALPRALDPGELLEERTVRALRGRGLLRPAPSRPLVAVTGRRALAALAACLVLFASGFALGRLQSRPPASAADPDGVRLVEQQGQQALEATPGGAADSSAAAARRVVWF